MPNLPSTVAFTEADRIALIQKVDEIYTALNFMVTLTNEERKSIKQISDKHYGFMTKLIDHATQHPEFRPMHMDMDKLSHYYDLVLKLNTIRSRVEQLEIQLSDTIALMGSEADAEARKYYKMVHVAAKDGVAGAQPIYDDLRSRFPVGNRTNNETPKP
ncbi:MAG: hypothetical protein JNN12_04125 [Bacteroidetes Order II. Incertae sedis bacterium]|nr:hypothetical protein [Bacteroidetes Order II. bacterium]